MSLVHNSLQVFVITCFVFVFMSLTHPVAFLKLACFNHAQPQCTMQFSGITSRGDNLLYIFFPMVLLSLYFLLTAVVKVLPTQRKRISWRRKKPETFELSPNSHAIIHMSSLGDQRNVIGILPLRRGPQPRGHFFTSESREVLDNLKAILTNCCDGKRFFNN